MTRVQLKLGDLGLEEVVAELAQAAARAVCTRLSLPEKEKAAAEATRPALREVLARYAVAFDVCGMSVICEEGEPIDVWSGEEGEGRG